MKITKLETLCLSRMHEPERQWVTARYRTVKADCAVVIIHTDEGLTGIGEASAYGNPTLIREWVTWLTPGLLGKDPNEPYLAPAPNGRGRAYDCAAAGIDCALWDLRAKIAGLPVSQLLADGAADQVRLYASSGCRYDWRYNPEYLIEEALGYIEVGFTAFKFRIGTEWAWDGVTVDRFLGLVRDLHTAVDDRMDLMLDGNCRLSYQDSLTIARELDRLDFLWFEEPLPKDDLEGYASLNAAVAMPISGGESFAVLEQFRPFLERNAFGIVQPDAGLSGITETARIANRAAEYGVDFCPHSWHNGLMCMAHAHMVAALPGARMVELCMIQGPLQWGILAEKPQVVDGHLILPDKPGFGVDLAENVAEIFPQIEGHYAIVVER